MCEYACMHLRINICVSAYTCLCVMICVCMCSGMYTYVYLCVIIFIHMWPFTRMKTQRDKVALPGVGARPQKLYPQPRFASPKEMLLAAIMLAWW